MNFLDIKDVTTFRGLPEEELRRKITPQEFDHIFRLCGALWLHSGDPRQPHAELTYGECSNGFVDVLRVLRHAYLCEMMAAQIIRTFPTDREVFDGTDWVVGSDHAGAALSHSVAMQLRAKHDFTEKGPDKSQSWKRFEIMPDENVLQIEELVTTTGTLQAVRNGIRNGNRTTVHFAPFVCTLVHRSDTYVFEGEPIHYVRHYDIQKWDPKDCPLCAQGSKRLKPKQNWAELTGGY